MTEEAYAHDIDAPVQVRVVGPLGVVRERSYESGSPAYLIEYEAEPGDVVSVWVREADLAAAPQG